MLFYLQCWMLFSFLFPTTMAFIVRLENNCGSGSPLIIHEDGTRAEGVHSYHSAEILSVFLDQGTGTSYLPSSMLTKSGSCGPQGENCPTVRVDESEFHCGTIGNLGTSSIPISLLYSCTSVPGHLTITFCPPIPAFVDQHVPPRFRRLVSRQIAEMLWTPIIIASILGSLAVFLLLIMLYMRWSRVPEMPMMIGIHVHPPLTPELPRHPPRSYVSMPRSQLFHDMKLFPAVHSEPMSVWED
ncbi:uncharacterized protein BT62DRAFT_1078627 [Guyanagaster necrorhizus]|uniref:Uncharacterized protein n=1 Tax=Guyanagaster necrorhizus TaxID=856835 RepID=A0A9P7VNT4_9AGAR|nr:uncharacterized protein BT62DRAFT_1078627 [Guyanagaster necrorhizus MCA 3950]KAG7443249.1 hypothetical protein BT62DRAFT_1078627 [Guyanagaster necrorhizus MCA 3950]